MRTIAVIEVNGRTYYFDINEDFSFSINYDEFHHFTAKSFKEAWGKFQSIAETRKTEIILY